PAAEASDAEVTTGRAPDIGAPAAGTPARLALASPPERKPALKAAPNKTAEESRAAAEMPAEIHREKRSALQSLSPEISYRYHSTDLTDFVLVNAHGWLETETPSNAPVVFAQETPEKAAPLLTRMVREVKYMVNGERPDLDRAGVKPAVVTLAHHPDGLLANESRQIKEGIHKFKEMFR
ncbi:MAG: hypothetical protein LRY55_06905, partial [Leadbetterella sp.]|nr:hypothetical protein [Leadbetterella sp.]